MQSARVLRETIQQVEQRIGSGGAPVASAPAKPANGVAAKGGRPIPRAAWQGAR